VAYYRIALVGTSLVGLPRSLNKYFRGINTVTIDIFCGNFVWFTFYIRVFGKSVYAVCSNNAKPTIVQYTAALLLRRLLHLKVWCQKLIRMPFLEQVFPEYWYLLP
jgi:hypothetical protein